MPVSFLSANEQRRYGRFPGEPTADELARFFYLDDADRALINRRRWDHTRLGFAVQLGTVRYLGTFLDDPIDVPAAVATAMAKQTGVDDPGCLKRYGEGRARRDHVNEIQHQYGYHQFTDPTIQFRLNRWLYALCWTGTDRPSVLFERTESWLRANKVLLPGLSILERSIARVRNRASQRLWQRLTTTVTSEQRHSLEELLTVPEGSRQSMLDRLRNGPALQSPAELGRAVRRLEEAKLLTDGLPEIDQLPVTRITSLARFAGAAKAQAISRLPDDRRIATLLAFVHSLEASAHDDVMDLFDIVVTKLFSDATAAGQKARLSSLKTFDAATIQLRQACAVVLDDDTPDRGIRAAVFSRISRHELEEAVAHIDAVARPAADEYWKELRNQHRRLKFLPHFLRTVSFGASPAGKAVMDAVDYLRKTIDGEKRRGPAPTAFAAKKWRSQLWDADNALDMTGYRLCLLDQLRTAVRRRDVYVQPSLRYADPRKGLLSGSAWVAARPAVCRSLGISATANDVLKRLSQRLHDCYIRVAENFPANEQLRIEETDEGNGLVLSPLDKLDDPPSLIALKEAIEARLPRVDLPEILLEIQAITGFANEFTHVSEGEARAKDLVTSICAGLIGEACNTGNEPLIKPEVPALRRSRLSWVRQNYFRADTLTAANAKLVAAQNKIALVKAWGNGDVASADGLRFVVPIRTIHAAPNPKYFGRGRGVTYYNLASDQYTGLNGIVVPGTLRDSLVLLSVVLEQETELRPTEIMTDTGAYTDVIFGIFYLLGFQFSPRLADIGGRRFWRVDKNADYGALDDLAANRINTKIIAEHWDDLLRLAGSLKLGVVQAHGLMRVLQTNDRPTKLARAAAELGRLIKTLYLLDYIDDEDYRRRILTQLNRGEGRHALARAVFHGKRGELRQRYRQGQEDQLGALGLVVNVIVLWNTIYMDATIEQLRREGMEIRDEEKARLSPLDYRHINMLGRYSFTLPEMVERGQLRPLRDPNQPMDEI